MNHKNIPNFLKLSQDSEMDVKRIYMKYENNSVSTGIHNFVVIVCRLAVPLFIALERPQVVPLSLVLDC